MRIGFDVDGVLAASGQAMIDVFERVLGRSIRYDEIHCFDLARALGASEEEIHRAFGLMDREGAWELVPPVDGAVALARWLVDEGHVVSVVTSRPDHLQDPTRRWFARNGFPELPLHFAADGDKAGLLRRHRLDLQVFVEDHADFARPIARAGTRVLLVDRPWNRREALGPGMTRCADLARVRRHLEDWIGEGLFD